MSAVHDWASDDTGVTIHDLAVEAVANQTDFWELLSASRTDRVPDA